MDKVRALLVLPENNKLYMHKDTVCWRSCVQLWSGSPRPQLTAQHSVGNGAGRRVGGPVWDVHMYSSHVNHIRDWRSRISIGGLVRLDSDLDCNCGAKCMSSRWVSCTVN